MAMQNGVVNKRMIVAVLLFLVAGGAILALLFFGRKIKKMDEPDFYVSTPGDGGNGKIIRRNLNGEKDETVLQAEGRVYLSLGLDESKSKIAATTSGNGVLLVEYDLSTGEETILVTVEEMERYLEEEGVEKNHSPAWRVAYHPGGGISFYYCSRLWLYSDGECVLLEGFPREYRGGGVAYRWIDSDTVYVSAYKGWLKKINVYTGEEERYLRTDSNHSFEYVIGSDGSLIYHDDKTGWYILDTETETSRLLCEAGFVTNVYAISPDGKYLLFQEENHGITGSGISRLILLDISAGKTSVIKKWGDEEQYAIIW